MAKFALKVKFCIQYLLKIDFQPNLQKSQSAAAGVENNAEEGPAGKECGGGVKRMKRREKEQSITGRHLIWIRGCVIKVYCGYQLLVVIAA